MFNDLRVWILGGVVLVALTNGRDVSQRVANAGAVTAERTEAGQERRALAREARYAAKASSIALERVQAGCVPVAGNKPTITPEGIYRPEVTLVEGMAADNGYGTPLDGVIICTGAGDTAMTEGGIIRDVVRVAPEDMAEYMALFQQIPVAEQPAQVNLQSF